MNAISRGLFEQSDHHTDERPSGMTDLARHLERAERVKLRMGDNEVELGRSALRRGAAKPPGSAAP